MKTYYCPECDDEYTELDGVDDITMDWSPSNGHSAGCPECGQMIYEKKARANA